MPRIYSKDVKLTRTQKRRLQYVLCDFIWGDDPTLINIEHSADSVKLTLQMSSADWTKAMGESWPKEDMSIEVKRRK